MSCWSRARIQCASTQPAFSNPPRRTAHTHSSRSWVLFGLALLAVVLVVAPAVRAQEDDAAAKPDPLAQYKAMANEYLGKAQVLGTQYAAQAQDMAKEYMGKANEVLGPLLEKVTGKKVEL